MNVCPRVTPVSVSLFWIVGGLAIFCCGCSEDPLAKSGPRRATIPIHGQVLVNDKPAKHVVLRFVPETELESTSASRGRPATSASTDSEGNFQVSTYAQGDGAPPGTYKVLFIWRKRVSLRGDDRKGNDLLGGKYSDIETSEFKVEVKPDLEGILQLPPYKLEADLEANE